MSQKVRDIVTEAFNRANLVPRKRDLPADMLTTGIILLKGVLQDFSNKKYIQAYKSEFNFVPTKEKTLIGPGDDCDIKINDLMVPSQAYFKEAESSLDYVPMSFISYDQFYSAGYNDYIISWKPVSEGTYEIFVKPRFIKQGREVKIIYNIEMKYNDNDVISLPTPYLELLTRALAYKVAVNYPRVDATKVNLLKAEFEELNANLEASNASQRILTRDGFGGRSLMGSFLDGSFISDRWY